MPAAPCFSLSDISFSDIKTSDAGRISLQPFDRDGGGDLGQFRIAFSASACRSSSQCPWGTGRLGRFSVSLPQTPETVDRFSARSWSSPVITTLPADRLLAAMGSRGRVVSQLEIAAFSRLRGGNNARTM